jgi:hypothetical protein
VTNKKSVFFTLQPAIWGRENTSTRSSIDLKFDWVLTQHVARQFSGLITKYLQGLFASSNFVAVLECSRDSVGRLTFAEETESSIGCLFLERTWSGVGLVIKNLTIWLFCLKIFCLSFGIFLWFK